MNAEQQLTYSVRAERVRGTFEAHLTIAAEDLHQRLRFQAWCAARRIKCVLIELPQGVVRSQPMSASYHRGQLADVADRVADLARQMSDEGFALSRIKLEAVATNEGVPLSDAQAQNEPDRYFEFHAKLALPRGTDLEAVRTFCEERHSRLSSNALKQEREGHSIRFVTARAHAVGREGAYAQFDGLLRELNMAGYAVVNQVREYALFDSAIDLDAGWLDQPQQGS